MFPHADSCHEELPAHSHNTQRDASTSIGYGDFRLTATGDDLRAAATKPLNDPGCIVHTPSKWQRFANTSNTHHRDLMALLAEYYLDEATAIPTSKGPTRPMRIAAKKEGQRMISILKTLLAPNPNTHEVSDNITNACHKAREALLISWAQTHLSWDAAIEFAKMVKDVEPSEDTDYDTLLSTASRTFPLEHKDASPDSLPPPRVLRC